MPLVEAVGAGAVGVVNRRREVAALYRLANALFVSHSAFLDLERRLESQANGGIAVPRATETRPFRSRSSATMRVTCSEVVQRLVSRLISCKRPEVKPFPAVVAG